MQSWHFKADLKKNFRKSLWMKKKGRKMKQNRKG